MDKLEHLNNAVPDIYIMKNEIQYIAEIFAGQTGVKTNLATQSIRYLNDVKSLEYLRFFNHKLQNKVEIIKAWKKGGVLENETVFKLFQKYDERAFLTHACLVNNYIILLSCNYIIY